MTADEAVTPPTDWPPVDDPGVLRSLSASIAAVANKETRWRMRGRRAFVVLTLYMTLLALLVFAVYQLAYDSAATQWTVEGELVRTEFVPGRMSAIIGQAIFTVVLVVQMTLTMLLAPALTSGAVSSEREKQTLELLITSPISTLGMVVGKLLSSLAYIFLLILASIPLMSLVFAFGGIAPDDVLRAYLLLFVVAFGIGSIGLFMSALIKRTQLATALSYLIVLLLTVGSLFLHTYLLVTSAAGPAGDRPAAPEALLWLNPPIAVMDVGCTAIPESYNFTCQYVAFVTGQEFDFASPPRDAFWPRLAVAYLVLGIGLTLATTQLIAPSRRLRHGGDRRGQSRPRVAARSAQDS